MAAAQIEFSQRGYAAATARTMAARAGVAIGSFYQYFRDKDAVLLEIARERHAAVAHHSLGQLETAPPTAAIGLEEIRARFRAVVALVIEFHRRDPGLHAVLTERRHADPALDALTSEAERSIVERVGELLERWGFQGDRLATAFVLFGMVEGSVHAHVLGARVVDDERFVDALVEALIQLSRIKETMPWLTSS
ncbi:MAG TPA: TetR family transcriptional regulator [Polyangiaceae bacterium]|nr:TetR family transcriptional regulator [Polyangiaceae bacterium]